MDIDEATSIAINETSRQDAHEASENDEVGLVTVNLLCQCGIECFAIGEIFVRDRCGSNAVLFGDLQPGSVSFVANDGRHLTRQLRLQQRFHVATTTGDEDDDFFHAISIDNGRLGLLGALI